MVNNDSQTVTASYTGVEIESKITFDGDNVLSPGESFELTLSIENLFVEPNQITVDIESVFGDDEDTNLFLNVHQKTLCTILMCPQRR